MHCFLTLNGGLRALGETICHIQRHPENQSVGNFTVMQVEKIRRLIVAFKRRQVLRPEMRVRLFTGEDRKQEGLGPRSSCSGDTVCAG
jgi:hypothetical protein